MRVRAADGQAAHMSLEAEKCAVLLADTTYMSLLPSGLSLGFRADHWSSGVSQRRALELLVAADALLACPCCGGGVVAGASHVGAGTTAMRDLRVL